MIIHLEFGTWGATLDLSEAELLRWSQEGTGVLSNATYASLREQANTAADLHVGDERARILGIIGQWDAIRARGKG